MREPLHLAQKTPLPPRRPRRRRTRVYGARACVPAAAEAREQEPRHRAAALPHCHAVAPPSESPPGRASVRVTGGAGGRRACAGAAPSRCCRCAVRAAAAPVCAAPARACQPQRPRVNRSRAVALRAIAVAKAARLCQCARCQRWRRWQNLNRSRGAVITCAAAAQARAASVLACQPQRPCASRSCVVAPLRCAAWI